MSWAAAPPEPGGGSGDGPGGAPPAHARRGPWAARKDPRPRRGVLRADRLSPQRDDRGAARPGLSRHDARRPRERPRDRGGADPGGGDRLALHHADRPEHQAATLRPPRGAVLLDRGPRGAHRRGVWPVRRGLPAPPPSARAALPGPPRPPPSPAIASRLQADPTWSPISRRIARLSPQS